MHGFFSQKKKKKKKHTKKEEEEEEALNINVCTSRILFADVLYKFNVKGPFRFYSVLSILDKLSVPR